MNKELIIENIKEWVQLDNELKELQKAAKERRNRKKEITEVLVNIMRDNEIDCFNMNEGKIIYTQSKVKGTLSKKYLLETLTNYYKNNPEQGMEVAQYILDNREEKIKENIRRKV